MSEIGWKNNSDGQGEAYRAATSGHYFTCPECGGHYFGRDTSRDEHGEIVLHETGRCQTGNCNWRGKLSEEKRKIKSRKHRKRPTQLAAR